MKTPSNVIVNKNAYFATSPQTASDNQKKLDRPEGIAVKEPITLQMLKTASRREIREHEKKYGQVPVGRAKHALGGTGAMHQGNFCPMLTELGADLVQLGHASAGFAEPKGKRTCIGWLCYV
jgi:hypothetical protein